MKVTLIQTDIAWNNPIENLQRAEEALLRHPQTDLFLLPEMFTTGFCTRPSGVADVADGATLHWMKRMSELTGAGVAGTVAVEEEGRYYNRLYFTTPEGVVHRYDKRHLFSYGEEHLYYSAGDERVIITHCGTRILLATCYDLRFPVWTRCRNDYDMIIYLANWPQTRRAVWDTLLRARAMENQCYVAGVNRVGEDPVAAYNGGTMLIDPYGNILTACSDGLPCEVAGEVEVQRVASFRAKFPALDDADNFTLMEASGQKVKGW